VPLASCSCAVRSSKTQYRRQAAGGNLKSRVDLVQVPAQPVLQAGPLADQLTAVVRQQLDLSGRAVQGRDRQAWMQRGQGHRFSVDRVGLAGLPAATPRAGHQPGRHAVHDPESG
jgi:hypothetical protein